jgi:uncharacterized membrane protein YfcA
MIVAQEAEHAAQDVHRPDPGSPMPIATASATWLLLVIGLTSGVLSGFFGIGGGLLIVPALIYLAGFSQHNATGTSLAVLLPPIGLAGFLEYYRHGNVDGRAAVLVALGVFVGAGFGAYAANRVPGPYLRLAFGVFVIGLGIMLVAGAVRRLGWM